MQHTSTTICTVLLSLVALAGAARGEERPRIEIASGDVAALVAAVGDPANAGAQVQLAAGVYHLAAGLELQPDMDLVGSNEYQDVDGDGLWDPFAGGDYARAGSETVLDASGVTFSPLALAVCGEAAPRASGVLGPLIQVTANNSVRNLTVRFSAAPAIGPAVTPGRLRDGGVHFEVSGTILESGSVGVGAIHNDCAHAGLSSVATVERNVLRNLGASGVLFANTLAPGARWHGLVRHNRSYGNGRGLALNAGGTGSDGGEITVESAGNRFEGNKNGVVVTGGREGSFLVPGFLAGGSDNRVDWSSRGDAFAGNTRNGGIIVTGSDFDDPLAGASDGNRVRLTVLDASFSGNRAGAIARDITLIGGKSGTGNQVLALVRNAVGGAPGSFVIVESAGNSVQVVGEPAFAHTNESLVLPGD